VELPSAAGAGSKSDAPRVEQPATGAVR
jgi:hypothetical protein